MLVQNFHILNELWRLQKSHVFCRKLALQKQRKRCTFHQDCTKQNVIEMIIIFKNYAVSASQIAPCFRMLMTTA